jgi:hypothetical protein
MENDRFLRHRVHFREEIYKRRQPYDDEYSVMREVTKHISSCRRCTVPADQQQEILLCRKGYLLAMDVWKYLRLEHDRILSTTSMRTSGYKTEVKIPSEFAVVPRLLSQHRATTSGHVQSPRTPSRQQQHRNDSLTSIHRTTKPREHHRPKESAADEGFVLLYATIPSLDLPLRIRRSDVRSLLA